MESACPVCQSRIDSQGNLYLDQWFASLGLFKDAVIVHCKVCGLGRCQPYPDQTTLEHFYESVYRSRESPWALDFGTLRRHRNRDPRSMAQLSLALQFTQFGIGDVFVDIGPGWGRSFKSAAELLPNPDMYAIELQKGVAAAYRRLYDVTTYSSLTDLGTAQPTIVLASHSFEHLPLPALNELLIDLACLIRPGGVLVAEVPHVDMRHHANVRGNDSPHLLFCTPDSMFGILEGAGFETLFIDTCCGLFDQKPSSGMVQMDATIPPGGRTRRSLLQAIGARLPARARRAAYSMAEFLGDRRGPRSLLADENFRYGGNRDCLRFVARPVPDSRSGHTCQPAVR